MLNRDEEFEKIRLALSQFEGVEVITGKELCRRLMKRCWERLSNRFVKK